MQPLRRATTSKSGRRRAELAARADDYHAGGRRRLEQGQELQRQQEVAEVVDREGGLQSVFGGLVPVENRPPPESRGGPTPK